MAGGFPSSGAASPRLRPLDQDHLQKKRPFQQIEQEIWALQIRRKRRAQIGLLQASPSSKWQGGVEVREPRTRLLLLLEKAAGAGDDSVESPGDAYI